MNSREFAKAWLERNGLFDKDSDYDGWLGECALKAWEFLAEQGHSGGSMSRMIALLNGIYQAYENPGDPLWLDYWRSGDGRKLMAQVEGRELTDEEVEAMIARMVQSVKP